MAAPVQTIDFDAVFKEITDRLEVEDEARLQPPLIQLFDGDWNLRGICKQEISANFIFKDNEAGTATLEMPADYYLSEWAVDVDARQTTNIHMTMDKDGARWDGRLDELQADKDEDGRRIVRLIFKSSMEELHHILAWSNPFAWPPALN